ncbi:hypothetical protein EVAR_65789_1 [Eumeta japonica]|uniref:Uncharacterized protein n=1 Tax=Eumeta variegata TaxID=151549 RepID=A0A4C2A341_EUMVA|nr:hypothetical protein EVAR_65789_1 [Eumeta japonica]
MAASKLNAPFVHHLTKWQQCLTMQLPMQSFVVAVSLQGLMTLKMSHRYHQMLKLHQQVPNRNGCHPPAVAVCDMRLDSVAVTNIYQSVHCVSPSKSVSGLRRGRRGCRPIDDTIQCRIDRGRRLNR